MKKITLLGAMVFSFVACNNNNVNQVATTETDTTAVSRDIPDEPLMGGDKDERGCIGSAGQSWSELLQECVQVFNIGTHLNPVEVKEGEAVISAFIVTKADDNSQVELFITAEETNPFLKQEKDGTYTNGKYVYNPKTQELFVDGKVAYKGENSKM
jgi:hypothetical protein